MTDLAQDRVSISKTANPPFKHVAAVCVGNALEFYDFITYTFFATEIGNAFFPGGDQSVRLLASLATFGVGFIPRPIGAIVIGAMGDRVGRKPAMMLSFTLMGLAIVGLALTPSYASIGFAAPVSVVFFRLVQGFALGGEVGPTTAFLLEAAPPHRRGLYASAQSATQGVASLLGGLVSVTLAASFSAAFMGEWGWRLAMLAGVVVVPVGLAIRRNLPETLHGADDAAIAPDTGALRRPVTEHLRAHRLIIAAGLMLLISGTIGTYVSNYMTTYAKNTLHMGSTAAFGVNVVSGLCSAVATVAGGYASDFYGRKRVMLISGLILLVTFIPTFRLIVASPGILTLYLGTAWLQIVSGFNQAPILVALTEGLPRHIRSGTVAIVYATAICIFGGTTQFVVQGLIDWTGDPLVPAYYRTGALLIGLAAVVIMAESAPRVVRRRSNHPA